jgi:hypothetical protein
MVAVDTVIIESLVLHKVSMRYGTQRGAMSST